MRRIGKEKINAFTDLNEKDTGERCSYFWKKGQQILFHV